MEKSAISRPLIGMLRIMKKPNQVAVAAAYAAKMIDCDFVFFHPEDINFTKKEIKGKVYLDGKWKDIISRLPDVVDNSPPKKQHRAIFQQLEKITPITMRRIGNKDKVNQRIMKENVYSHLIIPFQKAVTLEGLLKFIREHHKIVLKPAGGNQGKGIYMIEAKRQNFMVKGPNINQKMNNHEFAFWAQSIIKKRYIFQKYIDSTTKNNIPFDIRIHIRRGRHGKWNAIQSYVRIGNGNIDNITSNISQGGSIAKLIPFLKNNYPNHWQEIRKELNDLSKQFPIYFQKGYKYVIDAIGLDVGIDKEGKLWLFEVNSYPGSTSFELKSQIVAMEYAKYLAMREG